MNKVSSFIQLAMDSLSQSACYHGEESEVQSRRDEMHCDFHLDYRGDLCCLPLSCLKCGAPMLLGQLPGIIQREAPL
jgi:hypothetical protein